MIMRQICSMCKKTKYLFGDGVCDDCELYNKRSHILTGDEPLEYIITLTNYLFNHGYSTDEMMSTIKWMDEKGILGNNSLRIINNKEILKE